ncbi:MAG TPA: hypothetical protein VF599_04330 [Pyrinomonadaceae bacterium]|jgi:hypothetical protein
MTKKSFSVFAFLLFLTINLSAQAVQPSPMPTRARLVGSSATPAPAPSKVVVVTATPTPKPAATPVSNPVPIDRPVALPTPTPTPVIPQNNYKILSFGQIKSKIAEAKRLMQTRPMPTGLTDGAVAMDIVRLAFYDWKTQKLDFVVLTKTAFLSKNAQIALISSNGKAMNVRIIRANGVNTPVTIFDQTGEIQMPLVVQYPVERGGRYMETAYYTSTHTGVVTPEVVSAGQFYVRNTIDVAREKLREKGIIISPQIADFAERLSTVEHVDHLRFRTEPHQYIYNDIFTLYALNEGQTYRYSVSSAGAGGMVQMIPSTYYMVRNRFYNVGLMPDFVEGMRNHQNAAQAMLLYMKMTWDDLIASETVYNALADGKATPADLMAAGYNSNPAKLAGYIKRGGSGWRNLIPRETKIYLQIYASLERYVPMTPRAK